MDYIWCLCKAKEPNIHLEAILYTFGGNFGSFQSQKSFGANLPPPVSQRKFQSLFQIGLSVDGKSSVNQLGFLQRILILTRFQRVFSE